MLVLRLDSLPLITMTFLVTILCFIVEGDNCIMVPGLFVLVLVSFPPPFTYTATGNSSYPTPFVLTLGGTILLENAEISNEDLRQSTTASPWCGQYLFLYSRCIKGQQRINSLTRCVLLLSRYIPPLDPHLNQQKTLLMSILRPKKHKTQCTIPVPNTPSTLPSIQTPSTTHLSRCLLQEKTRGKRQSPVYTDASN
jgi:hypothetical protein